MKKSAPKKLSSLVLILWALAALLIFDFGSHFTKGIRSHHQATDNRLDTPAPQPLDKSLSKKERILLQGDISRETPEEQWLALHELEPENPVYYANYLKRLGDLPENFHATIAKIDPDNGWFLFLEAAQNVKEVIEKGEKLDLKEKNRLKDEGLPLPPKQLVISDPKSLSERLALLEKAVASPKWENYESEIAEERFHALPEAHDVLSGLKNFTTIGNAYSPSLRWNNIAELTSAALQAAKTKEEFLALETLILKIEERSFERIETIVDGLVYQAVIAVNSGNLYHAADQVGLKSKVKLYQEREMALHRHREHLKNRSHRGTQELHERRGSIFSLLSSLTTSKFLKTPPPLTQELLKPSLRAERALISQVFFGLIFIVLSLGALLTWIHKRKKENPARFQPELSTLGLGVLLPFTALIFFRYFLSFGMLDYGGRLMTFGNYLLPEIAILLILLATPLCLLRTRNYPEASRLKIWWPLATLIISLLLSSAMMPLHEFGLTIILILSTPLSLMIVAVFGLIFPRLKKKELVFDLTSRLAPAYLFAATLSGLFVIGLQIEERHWFAQERFVKPSPRGFTVMENQVVDILKKEMSELMK